MIIFKENKKSLSEVQGQSSSWEELISSCHGKYLSRISYYLDNVIVARFTKVKASKQFSSIGFSMPNGDISFCEKDIHFVTKTPNGFVVQTKSKARWEIVLN